MRSICVVLSLVIAAGIVAPAFAADALVAATPSDLGPMPHYGQWHSSRIGGGGYVMNVVLSATNPNRYYTYIDVGGLYRSDDAAKTWNMLHGALPPRRGNYSIRGLSVDPRDDSKLVVVTGCQWDVTEGIYLSEDAGNSWTAAPGKIFFDGNGGSRGNGQVIARHPTQPDIILAASLGNGIWRSENNGRKWTMIGMEKLHASDIRFDRTNPDRLWLCTRKGKVRSEEYPGGFFRSDDGGKTWQKLADDSPSEVAQDHFDAQRLYGLRGNMVVLSTDAGATWQTFSKGLALNPEKANSTNGFAYNALAVGPDFVLVGSSNGTIYRLNRGDNAWTKIQREKIDPIGGIRGAHGAGWAMSSIIIDPRDANHWFFTDFFGISQTFDAGKNWQFAINGLEDTVIHAVVQDPTDPGVVHLGMADNAYFTSIDGGATFKRYAFPQDAISCKDIALNAKLPSRLYAVGSKLWDQQIGQVYVSIDRGAKWEKSPMGGLPDLSREMCTSIAVDPNDPYTVYLAVSGAIRNGGGGPYKSTDGGKTWTWFGQGLPEGKSLFWNSPWAQGRELAAGADGALVAISRGGDTRGVYRFDPKAAAWSRCAIENLPGAPNSVVADLLTTGRFFVAVRDGCIYRSTDSGVSWTKVYNGSATHVIVDRAVANRAAASTKDGVILSTDGGGSWKELDKSLPDRVLGNMPAFAGERLVVGSDGSGAFWIPLSPAGEQPVQARPAAAADIPDAMRRSVEAPKVTNLKMESGTTSPEGWKKWTSAGQLEVLRDTKVFRSGKASLLLQSVGGPAKGTAYQDFAAVATPFEVNGWAKVAGSVDKAQVAIQVFDASNKQVAWIVIDSITGAKDGKWFTKQIALPPDAAQCKLLLLLEGDGKVWLDELKLTPKPLRAFP